MRWRSPGPGWRIVPGLLAITLLAAPSLRGAEPASTATRAAFERVDRLLQEHVEERRIAGAVALVIQGDAVVYEAAVGFQDVEASRPMAADTIFRIASMTKPVTSVAVMVLHDEGRLDLDDPLSKYVPEFSQPRVVVSNDPFETRPAGGEITIRQLLTHTAGIPYGFAGSAHERLHQGAGVTFGLSDSPLSLEENIRRLAGVPLAAPPGEAWVYGMATDVLGRVVEVAAEIPFDEFVARRILQPLGMDDTHFVVPEQHAPRLAALYRPGPEGRIERVGEGVQQANGVTYSATFSKNPDHRYVSGGAGLASTAVDYGRFLRMLARGGELNGVRLLEPETVAQMTRNQIGQLDCPFTIHGNKFGYGFGVHTEDHPQRHGASIGTYSWGGIFHTYFWVDPQRDVVGVVLTQLFPFGHLTLWGDFQQRTYEALEARD